jgi:hypothetical protein
LDLWRRNSRAFDPRQTVELLQDASSIMLYIRPQDQSHRQYLAEAVAIARRYPEGVPRASLASSLQKLAESYINVDRRYGDARPLLAEALTICRSDPTRGDLLLQTLQSWGRVNRFLADHAADESAQHEAYELTLRTNGAASPTSIQQHSIWAQSLIGAGRAEDAYRESLQALAEMRGRMPVRGSPLLWTSVSVAATAACLSRRFAECETLAREAIQTLGAKPNPEDLRLVDAEGLLGLSLAGQQRHAEAREYVERAMARNNSLKRRPAYMPVLESVIR